VYFFEVPRPRTNDTGVHWLQARLFVTTDLRAPSKDSVFVVFQAETTELEAGRPPLALQIPQQDIRDLPLLMVYLHPRRLTTYTGGAVQCPPIGCPPWAHRYLVDLVSSNVRARTTVTVAPYPPRSGGMRAAVTRDKVYGLSPKSAPDAQAPPPCTMQDDEVGLGLAVLRCAVTHVVPVTSSMISSCRQLWLAS
jgi:hypothetical protein